MSLLDLIEHSNILCEKIINKCGPYADTSIEKFHDIKNITPILGNIVDIRRIWQKTIFKLDIITEHMQNEIDIKEHAYNKTLNREEAIGNGLPYHEEEDTSEVFSPLLKTVGVKSITEKKERLNCTTTINRSEKSNPVDHSLKKCTGTLEKSKLARSHSQNSRFGPKSVALQKRFGSTPNNAAEKSALQQNAKLTSDRSKKLTRELDEVGSRTDTSKKIIPYIEDFKSTRDASRKRAFEPTGFMTVGRNRKRFEQLQSITIDLGFNNSIKLPAYKCKEDIPELAYGVVKNDLPEISTGDQAHNSRRISLSQRGIRRAPEVPPKSYLILYRISKNSYVSCEMGRLSSEDDNIRTVLCNNSPYCKYENDCNYYHSPLYYPSSTHVKFFFKTPLCPKDPTFGDGILFEQQKTQLLFTDVNTLASDCATKLLQIRLLCQFQSI